MSALDLLSPAKLNLFLHITGRRADGYHQLQTLFQLLDFGDRMRVETADDSELRLHCPGLALPPADNLALRAALMLRDRTGCSRGAHIHIDKRIPAGGGLGGGSSNAATVLLALNHLWDLGLAPGTLAEIGLALGADVPVFVHGHSAWAEGIGEQLTPVEIAPAHYLVVDPGCPVSTAQVFSDRQLTRNTSPITIATFFAEGGQNDCENVVRRLYPEVDKALNWLEKFGPARLTGTGACAFLTLASEERAREVQRQLPGTWNSFVAGGTDRSPVLDTLAQAGRASRWNRTD